MSYPLAAFPLARTNDADEAQAVLSRELSALRFNSVRHRHRFQFEMNGAHLGRTLVAFNRFETEAQIDAGVIENAVIVSLSVGPSVVLDLDGEAIGPDSLAIVSPSRRLKIHRAAGSGVLILRVGIDALTDRVRELTGRATTRPFVFDRSAALDKGAGARIRRLMAYVIEDAANGDAVLSNRLMRASLDDMLLNAILAVPNNHNELLSSGVQNDEPPGLVRRAEEFMVANATEPITISDLVVECGCSRRALFNAFRRHRGTSPLRFLHNTRLDTARQALLNASPTDSVTSIALACGFLHAGRFASAYRNRFGEKPSETKRKS